MDAAETEGVRVCLSTCTQHVTLYGTERGGGAYCLCTSAVMLLRIGVASNLCPAAAAGQPQSHRTNSSDMFRLT